MTSCVIDKIVVVTTTGVSYYEEKDGPWLMIAKGDDMFSICKLENKDEFDMYYTRHVVKVCAKGVHAAED